MIRQKFQKLLDALVGNKTVAGCAVLLFKDGTELAYAASGVRDLALPAPFDRKTVMRMYSMTKVVTAAAVMTLWDKGLLTPESPVCDFFPSFADLTVCGKDGVMKKAQNTIRIQHLLTMTSGIPYQWPANQGGAIAQNVIQELGGLPDSERNTVTMAAKLGHCPVLFEPGAEYYYGMSADVLGGIVEKVTGQTFEDYLSETFFKPLGMTDTAFTLLPHMAERVARKYVPGEDSTLLPDDSYTGIPAVDNSPNIQLGGSGLYSTLDDFVKFGEMLRLDGMGIIRPETVREMTKNQLPDAISPAYIQQNGGYGYGYQVRTLTDPSLSNTGEGLGAFGWSGMAGTDLRIDPVRGYTLVFGVQRVPGPTVDLLSALKDVDL